MKIINFLLQEEKKYYKETPYQKFIEANKEKKEPTQNSATQSGALKILWREERWMERTTQTTGYYYFGARYYDVQRSVWMTSDPAVEKFMDGNKEGKGGIYNYANLNTYHYCSNNPIRYVDPTGENQPDMLLPDGRELEYDKINDSAYSNSSSPKLSFMPQLEFGLAQTSNAAFFTSVGLKSINTATKVSTNLGYLSIGLSVASTLIDVSQFIQNPNFSNGVDLFIDGLVLIPATSWIGIGLSFAKIGAEIVAEELVIFAEDGMNRVDNYLHNQMNSGFDPNNWDVPDGGLAGVFWGYGY